MDTKLTLKLDKDVIERAKHYASEKNKSLSAIIESYLQALTSDEGNKELEEISISAFVKSLSLKTDLPSDFNYKKDLGDYYSEKYK